MYSELIGKAFLVVLYSGCVVIGNDANNRRIFKFNFLLENHLHGRRSKLIF